MKNKKLTITVIIVAALLVIAAVLTPVLVLNGKGKGKTQSDVKRKVNPNEKEVVKTTDKKIIANGATGYKILIPAGASEDIITAASELKMFLSEATGVDLEIVTSAGSAHYFSLGETSLAKSKNVKIDFSVTGGQGYGIKTVGDDIFIYAATDLGVVYGVYGYLERTLNYDFFYTEVYTVDKTDVLNFCEYDVIDIPDVAARACSYGYQSSNIQTLRRMRYVKYEDSFPVNDGISMWHNAVCYFDFKNEVNDDFFNADRTQLCYTAHGNPASYTAMINQIADKMFKFMTDNGNTANEVVFSLMDNNDACDCPACTADKEAYGAESSSVIKLLNKVAPILEGKLREAGDPRADTFLIDFYAYFYLEDAPVERQTDAKGNVTFSYPSEMVLNKHVTPFIAPFYAYYTKSFYSEENKSYRETIENWKAIASNIHLWIYDTYFKDESGYMLPFDTFSAVADLYRLAYENDVCFIYTEGQWQNRTSTGWAILKGYLGSKLGWDVYADVNALTDKFFKAMYGSGAEEMKTVYNEMRVLFARQNAAVWQDSGYCHAIGLCTEAAYPRNLMLGWLKRLEAIEADLTARGEAKAAQNVRLETVSPLYITVKLYAHTLSAEENAAYKNKLVKYFNEFTFTNLSQGALVKDYVNGLGV